jgi:glycogen operon protein
VIYDVDVRGFTKLHPDIPESQRGTFAAMGSRPVISYLKDLGVTTLQLMSVHHFISECTIVQQGLTNYWQFTLSWNGHADTVDLWYVRRR